MIIVTCPKCQHKKQLAKPPEGGKYACPGCGAAYTLRSRSQSSSNGRSSRVPAAAERSSGQQAPSRAPKAANGLPERDRDDDTLQVQSAVIRLGDYLVLEMIARTPILKTYLAENTQADHKCVVKYLPSKFASNEEATSNFLSVGRELVKIRHPNIANVEFAGQFENISFMAQEYVQGPSGRQMTLAEYLKLHPKGRASEKRASKWARQIASALCAIHSQGIIHGAVRPENILIDIKGNVKLIDIGLAKAVSIKEDLITTPEAVDYMAPELRRGDGDPDHRSDMYSVGILFYRLLTGRLPGKFAELPSKIVPGIGEGWDNIIQCCTSDVPDDRFPSTDQLLGELEKLASVETSDIPEAIEVPDDAEDGGPPPGRPAAAAKRPQEEQADVFEDEMADLFATERPASRKPTTVHDDADYDSSNYLTGLSNIAQVPQEERAVQDDDSESHDTLAGMAVSAEPADPQDSLSGMAMAANRTAADKRRRFRAIAGKSNHSSKIYGLLVAILVLGLGFAILYIALGGDFSQRKTVIKKEPAPQPAPPNPQTVPPQPQPQPQPQPPPAETTDTGGSSHGNGSVIPNPEDIVEGPKPPPRTDPVKPDPPVETVKPPPPANLSSFANSIGIKMILIPAGEFMMGSPNSEQGRKNDEKQHKVAISKGFYMAATEVTQQQWKAIMNEEKSRFKGNDLPVDDVTNYDDAAAFCRRLSEREGKKYRLPTEAEWEYACRAGTTTPYNTGATLEIGKASFFAPSVKDMGGGKTEKVGSFPANAWGLHDMHGNVWEWCSDYYGDYPAGAATDPKGATSGQGRILRGGAWNEDTKECRSAARYYQMVGAPFRTGTVGLRIVMDP